MTDYKATTAGRKTITKLRIDEVSLVDQGANPGALHVLYKRGAADAPAASPAAGQLILAAGGGSQKKDDTMQDDTMQDDTRRIEALEADLKKVTDDLKKVTDDLEKVTAERDMLLARAALSPDESEFLEKLEVADRDGFVLAPVKKRLEMMARATGASDDPVIKAIRADLEAITKRNAELEAGIIKERAERRRGELEAIAKADLASVPGTLEERVAMLQTIDKIADEADRARLMGLLRQSSAVFKIALRPAGFDGDGDAGGTADAADKLDRLVDAYAGQHKIDKSEAYGRVCKTDDGRRLLREARLT